MHTVVVIPVPGVNSNDGTETRSNSNIELRSRPPFLFSVSVFPFYFPVLSFYSYLREDLIITSFIPLPPVFGLIINRRVLDTFKAR
jgi:hypothetical protein